mgnify:CR=1 FL=1
MDTCRVCSVDSSQNSLTGRLGQDAVQSRVKVLQIALALLSGFFVLELTAALISHSLSLLAESAHVCSDIAALVVTLFAHSLARRWRYHSGSWGITPLRVEASAALINGLGLMVIALCVGFEAFSRFQVPHPNINGLPMLVTAGVGIAVNGCNALWLHPCSHENLNFRGAFLHSLADILSSLGVLVAAVTVSWLHWTWMDMVISLLVAGLIFGLALPLLFQSGHQLYVNRSTDEPLICNCDRARLEKLLFPTLQDCLK